MSNRQVRSNLTLLAAAIGGSFPFGAQAQETPAVEQQQGQIQEVLVTAQRRIAPESKTPVAMSVISGAQLGKAGLDRPSDVAARLPGVYMNNAADGLRITIRGVSNADATDKGEPSAAFMLDGVYIARPHAQNGDFLDVDRVEVLRGPQGTLYGRNTTAGVVNVISNTPGKTLEGAVGLEAGTFGARKIDGMLNLPVNDALALRAAVSSKRRDSVLRNAQGTPHELGLDRDDRSARLSARLDVNADASLLVRYDRTVQHDNNDVIVPDTNFYSGIETGKPTWRDASTKERLTNAFVPPNAVPEQGHSRRDSQGLSAELSWNLGPATLYYLGARRAFDHDFLVNYYYRIVPGFALGVRQYFEGAYDQDSHELRIATKDTGRVSAQAGVYWFREDMRQLATFRDLEPIALPPYYVFPTGPTVSKSRAVFGQATWRVLDTLRLTAGARTTRDDKSRVGSTNLQAGPVFDAATDLAMPNAARLEKSKTTWRLGIDADLDPSTLVYGVLSTGYKSGGFNDGCMADSSALGVACPAAFAVPAAALVYQPETLKSVELGLKTRFWANRASLNLAAYKYDYTNLQLSGVAMVQGVPRYVTSNAGVASVKGLEIEAAVKPLASARLTSTLAFTDAHYVDYTPDGIHSWAGYKLDRAPSATLTLGYEQGFGVGNGTLTAGAFTRSARAYAIGIPSQLLRYRVPGRTETDLSLGYQQHGAPWSLLLRVRNLQDKVEPVNIDSFGMTVPSEPRTVSLRMDVRF
ncbi:TonB-dependent receptor [Massilia sp. YIM B02769]|uniref:TonB-dependent receptor n=1 Tax=Massilia sp. YIM B02769 TaxID=3050129 RepID=UPI0025B70153|nr:TonB-dependent receptor [Massilia sp. YIM B02769]MDN4058194.1 TonB-dependent receptor [Massilia sp. YIM B02769]